MKKILSFLAAGALALGLIGCSGDLHDDEFNPIDTSKFETFELCGAMTGWKNDAGTNLKFTPTDNQYEYSVTFTALDAEQGFCFITKTGLWDDYQIGGESMAAGTLPEGISFSSKAGGGKHEDAILSGLTANAAYKMTVETSSGVYVVSLASTEAPASADPVPYYLDGELFVGCAAIGNGFDVTDTSWLLYGCTLNKSTGEVTYTKDFTASVCGDSWHTGDAVVKISDPNWKNTYGDTAITVGEDFVKLVAGGDNAPVSGLEAGKSYRAEIKTTPDKDVLIKIYELLQVSLKIKLTGIADGEGMTAVIGGNWDWPSGSEWTPAWGGSGTLSSEKLKTGVIGEDGTVTISVITNSPLKAGESLSAEFSGYYGELDADGNVSEATGEIKIDGNNIKVSVEDIESAGVYIAIVNLDSGNVDYTKE